MTEAQEKSLLALLDEALSGEFSEETLQHHALYTRMRDALMLKWGQDSLRQLLGDMAKMERDEGYTVNVYYSEVNDIVFGDISLTPPLMDKYPLLCKWRLALVEEKESREPEGPRPSSSESKPVSS